MPSRNFCDLSYCLIPLSSDEPLWEWDLVGNTVFFSQGAIKALKLETAPRNMSDFYRLVPDHAAEELISQREGVISGKNGSVLECAYLCNGLWVQEYLMVLSRNASGQATRIMGRFSVSPLPGGDLEFKNANSAMPNVGIWVLDVERGLIWYDHACARIIGRGHDQVNPISEADSIARVHEAERDAIRRHYDLFCAGASLGNNIMDYVRVRQDNGEYASILVRAAALQRDASGRAILVGGIMSPSDPQKTVRDRISADDRLFHALSSMGAGQWQWDIKNDFFSFGPRFLEMLGYSGEDGEEFCRLWRDQIHPDDYHKVLKAIEAIIDSPENGDFFECTYRVRRRDGEWAWIFNRGYVIWRDSSGHARSLIGSSTNITTAQAERDRLEELVRHDTLTGLRSRAFCNLEIEHIEQNDIRPVSVISVDITGLKLVNDNLGHAAGDEMLTKAARILRSSLRSSDCIGRVGGDEFIVLLPNCNQDKSRQIMRKVVRSFAAYNAGSNQMPVFAGFGVATANTVEERVAKAIAAADEAMYQNKKENRKAHHAALKHWIKSLTGKEVDDVDRRVDD